jgi:hypothetical protein
MTFDRSDLIFVVLGLLLFSLITTAASIWFIAAYVPAVRRWLDKVWEFLIKR